MSLPAVIGTCGRTEQGTTLVLPMTGVRNGRNVIGTNSPTFQNLMQLMNLSFDLC